MLIAPVCELDTYKVLGSYSPVCCYEKPHLLKMRGNADVDMGYAGYTEDGVDG